MIQDADLSGGFKTTTQAFVLVMVVILMQNKYNSIQLNKVSINTKDKLFYVFYGPKTVL